MVLNTCPVCNSNISLFVYKQVKISEYNKLLESLLEELDNGYTYIDMIKIENPELINKLKQLL